MKDFNSRTKKEQSALKRIATKHRDDIMRGDLNWWFLEENREGEFNHGFSVEPSELCSRFTNGESWLEEEVEEVVEECCFEALDEFGDLINESLDSALSEQQNEAFGGDNLDTLNELTTHFNKVEPIHRLSQRHLMEQAFLRDLLETREGAQALERHNQRWEAKVEHLLLNSMASNNEVKDAIGVEPMRIEEPDRFIKTLRSLCWKVFQQ